MMARPKEGILGAGSSCLDESNPRPPVPQGSDSELQDALTEARQETDRAIAAVRAAKVRIDNLTRKYERAQNALVRIDRRYRSAESGHSGLAFDLCLIASKALEPDESDPVDQPTCNTDEGCDHKGTAFVRDNGFPCRKCGVKTLSKYMGNALACYVCPQCGDEIDP